MLWFIKKQSDTKPNPTPIADTLLEAANALGLEFAKTESGFLIQAKIIREIAQRLAKLERK